MIRSLALRIALGVSLAVAGVACKEEGAAEKVGRKMDEAVEKLRHGDEGAIERAGRKMDEAFDDAKDELGDRVDDLREKAAEAIEPE